MKEIQTKNSILIVDDDPKILAVLKKVLEKEGHEVIAADSADNFFAVLNSRLPDLIVLDVLLPGVDGFEIASRLKADRLTRDIPIIFLTVCSDSHYQVKGFQLGAVDYLNKPLELDVALARINTHLTINNLRKKLEMKNLRLNQEIEERSRAEITMKSALEEKEILLKEVHHRVKNNLQLIVSLLNLQSRRIDSQEGKIILDEIKNRVSSIALVHEKLYRSTSLAHIDFGEYIQTLSTQLFKSSALSAADVKLRIEADPFSLDIDKAIPSALMINELMTNALKYAFPKGQGGEISVIFRVQPISSTNPEAGNQDQINGEAILSVGDNGCGLPEDINIEQPKTLGMQIINALASQLHAKLVIDKPGNKGTRFTIRFPLGSGQDASIPLPQKNYR